MVLLAVNDECWIFADALPDSAPHPAERLGIGDLDPQLPSVLFGQAHDPVGEALPFLAPFRRVRIEIVLMDLAAYARTVDEHLTVLAVLHRAEHMGHHFDIEHNIT